MAISFVAWPGTPPGLCVKMLFRLRKGIGSLAGANVSPTALDYLFNLESRCMEMTCHLSRTEREEVNAHFLAPPFIQMNGVVSDVESQQQQATWLQNPAKLGHRTHDFLAGYDPHRWGQVNATGLNAIPV